MDRKLKYVEAVNEALHQKMEVDKNIVLIGQGLTSPWYVGGTCKGLKEKYPDRVFESPVSESGMTGFAVGLAIAGRRPVVIYPRMDFMLYACDQIINQAAKWKFMFGGAVNLPIVFWGIINRGGCQGAQHSQDFTWLFTNIVGLKVVSPTNPYSAKGLLVSAIENDGPVVFVDDRARYGIEGNVDEDLYRLSIESHKLGPKIRDFINCPVPASKPLEEKYFSLLKILNEVQDSIGALE